VVAVENTTTYVNKLIESVTEIQTRQTVLEELLSQMNVTINSEIKQTEMELKDIRIEIDQEITEIAEEVCREDFTQKASPCCPNCTTAAFRVPPKEECEKKGCEHSCAYENITCAENGDRLERPCVFPFKIGGKEYTTCTTDSPFGPVERPWCYLDTWKNKEQTSFNEELVDIGYCDCTELRCICPKGKRLGSDGKTCVEVEPNAAFVHTERRSAETHHRHHKLNHHKHTPTKWHEKPLKWAGNALNWMR
jgi:hypothetical protein